MLAGCWRFQFTRAWFLEHNAKETLKSNTLTELMELTVRDPVGHVYQHSCINQSKSQEMKVLCVTLQDLITPREDGVWTCVYVHGAPDPPDPDQDKALTEGEWMTKYNKRNLKIRRKKNSAECVSYMKTFLKSTVSTWHSNGAEECAPVVYLSFLVWIKRLLM